MLATGVITEKRREKSFGANNRSEIFLVLFLKTELKKFTLDKSFVLAYAGFECFSVIMQQEASQIGG